MDQALAMDRMYRYTRHVYDASRRYYLLGRDRLLHSMTLAPGDRVLEVGCGTARNLIRLHRIAPQCQLFGIDASQQMLQTAEKSVRRLNLDHTIRTRQGLAEQLDYRWAFNQREPFDVVFFSYSLSMMPCWKEALDNALAQVKPGGRVYIVDFWDQADLPRVFAAMLQRWLAVFHVYDRPELHARLVELHEQSKVTLTVRSIARRYAYLAELVTPMHAATE